MARRYIGDAVVTIKYNDDDTYSGSIRADDCTWKFDELRAAPAATWARDSAEAYDEMAASAVSFGSYYTSMNRGYDVPDWAPDPETADATDEATSWAMDDQGGYDVLRKKPKTNPKRSRIGSGGKRNPEKKAAKRKKSRPRAPVEEPAAIAAIGGMDAAAGRRRETEKSQLKRETVKWLPGATIESDRNFYFARGENGAWNASISCWADECWDAFPWYPTEATTVSFRGRGRTRAQAISNLRSMVEMAQDVLARTGRRITYRELFDPSFPGKASRRKKAAKRNPAGSDALRRLMRGT
jgi:hypothetical protein